MPILVEERQSERAAAPRPKRWRPILAISLVVAVILGAIALARQWPFTRQAVIQSLQQQSGSPVEVAAFHRFYFPHPGCIAEGVTFQKDRRTPPLITIQKLTIVGSYAGLLAHHLTTVRAEGFHLTARKESAAPESWEQLGRTNSGVTIGKLVADGAEVEFPAEQKNQA